VCGSNVVLPCKKTTLSIDPSYGKLRNCIAKAITYHNYLQGRNDEEEYLAIFKGLSG